MSKKGSTCIADDQRICPIVKNKEHPFGRFEPGAGYQRVQKMLTPYDESSGILTAQ